MSRAADRQAWGNFWQSRTGGTGCLPEALREIEAVQRARWEELARTLPRGARVLDLATGNGVVLGMLGAVRSDLKLTGVDSAPALPPSPRGLTLKAGVAMESLPFADGSFGAVTSQFGIEYGVIRETAVEVSRVLSGGGRFRAIVHHADGPILAHNRARREGLRWAAGTSGYLERARTFARARRMGPLPTPPSFKAAPAEARRLFPAQPVAEEFVTAILQTLELGRRGPPDEVLEVLTTLAERAENEIARIDSLEASVQDEGGITALQAALEGAGLATVPPEPLFEASGKRPFAWLLDAAHPNGKPSR